MSGRAKEGQVGSHLVKERTRKEASVAGAERARSRAIGDALRGHGVGADHGRSN